jgi:two-component system osmolarity sensor histidine kinase EnvZ
VALLVELYERNPTQETFADVQRMAFQPLRLDVSLEPGATLEKARCLPSLSVIDRYFRTALEQSINRTIWYDASCPGKQVEIRVMTSGGVMKALAFRDRVQARSGPLFVMWILGATALFTLVSVIFIRNQVRPIVTLATAMEQFGKGHDPGMYKARGAREVRQATHAFFDMRARIKRHIDQRAQLLAGVSHDLRTPLTRLKLQFALMAPSPEIEAAKQDLADMARTLQEYLDFSQGQWSEEAQLTDLSALVTESIDAARRGGADLQADIAPVLRASVRANTIRRAVHNLIDNAIAHGECVRVSALREGPQRIAICVEDDGPGIAEDQYEDAFRPFSRLNETRTKNSKGVGLGLAIARDVARSHGGDVVLARSDLGGLKATLRLPAAG